MEQELACQAATLKMLQTTKQADEWIALAQMRQDVTNTTVSIPIAPNRNSKRQIPFIQVSQSGTVVDVFCCKTAYN